MCVDVSDLTQNVFSGAQAFNLAQPPTVSVCGAMFRTPGQRLRGRLPPTACPAWPTAMTITASSNDGPLGVEPGAELVVRVLWGQDSALSEGVFKWPK